MEIRHIKQYSVVHAVVVMLSLFCPSTTSDHPNNASSTQSVGEYTQTSDTDHLTSDRPTKIAGFMRMNKTLTPLLNSTVSLSCPVNETSGENIVWKFGALYIFFGGHSRPPKHIDNVKFIRNGTGGTTELEISEINPNNSGAYKCHQGPMVKWFFVNVKMPISELYIRCNMTNCSSVQPDRAIWVILQCYGDSDPTEDFIWTVDDGDTAEPLAYTTELEIIPEEGVSTFRNGSVLFLDVWNRSVTGDRTVTCQHGDTIKTIPIEFLDNDTRISPEVMLSIVGLSGLIILVTAIIMYCTCTHLFVCDEDSYSDHSSMYSMPSVTGENQDDDGVTRMEQSNVDHVEPIAVPSRITKDSSPFEMDMDRYGIRLQSFRSRDKYNEFWDASLCGGDYTDPIVVRTLSGNATVDLLEEFRQFQIGLKDLAPHPNIWNVLGFSNDRLPYRICYEFHIQTTLREYLLGNFQDRDGSNEQRRQAHMLISLAADVASGMVFLKSYAFDHVALRTEKIVISPTTGCKLYDFCLSSQSQKTAVDMLDESELLAWLAPELIFLQEYNQWTDIWAFGVVLWEIWCGGRTPHCGKSRENLESDLRNQQFLVQPNDCPGAIYSIMLSCWKRTASERRMFNNIHKDLTRLKESDTGWYEDTEYTSLPGSTFYNVLDNNYDKAN